MGGKERDYERNKKFKENCPENYHVHDKKPLKHRRTRRRSQRNTVRTTEDGLNGGSVVVARWWDVCGKTMCKTKQTGVD